MVRVQFSSYLLSNTDRYQTGNLFPARLRTTHIEKHQNMTYRRNGKLQACEPCRKGKLRCDHMMPNCGRCVKKGKSDKCVYHPAPLTKSGVMPSQRVTKSDQISSNTEGDKALYQSQPVSRHSPTPSSYVVHLQHTNRPPSFLAFPRSVQSAGSFIASTPTSSTHSPDRQLGDHRIRTDAQCFDNGASFINHYAVLAENEPSIGLSPPESAGGSKIPQMHINKGAAVLELLKDLTSIQKYIDKWFSFAGGVVIIEPMVKIYLDGLWSYWHKILGSSKAADLQAMSAHVWENTSKPVSELLKRNTTPHAFCLNVTGPGLRWEVIGILTSLVSLVAQSLKGMSYYLSQTRHSF